MAKPETASKADTSEQAPFEIADTRVLPGEQVRLDLPIAPLPTRNMLSMPLTVVHGTRPGPRLWVSAALHGDEVNGVEIVRQLLGHVDAGALRGTLVAAPIVNAHGFIQQSRYLPDRRDLNRSFPGSAKGSLAARLAHLFMHEVVSRCTHGIDLHTAALDRTNFPQVRADLRHEETHRCARAFGAPLTIHARTRDGSLREAAADRGLPILLYEAGEARRFNRDAIQVGVAGVERVMACLGMKDADPLEITPETVEVSETRWVRAARSGIVRLHVDPGQRVEARQVLATISDAFGDGAYSVKAPVKGIVVGQSLTPICNRGDGLVHLAIAADADADESA